MIPLHKLKELRVITETCPDPLHKHTACREVVIRLLDHIDDMEVKVLDESQEDFHA